MANLNSPVVIPKRVTSGEELVVVPRKEYEGLLRFYKIQKTKKKKQDGKLTKGLLEALADVKAGRISKPYDDVDEMMKDMLA